MAKTRVGINGFGRIGRNFFRASLTRDADFEIVAFNDLGDARRWRTCSSTTRTLGPLAGDVERRGRGRSRPAGSEMKVLAERDPARCPGVSSASTS